MRKIADFKKYLKLNSMRRIVILGFTLIAAFLTIILGSTLYTSKSHNVQKSNEYTNSAQYSIKVKQPTGSKTSVDDIAAEIYNRIDPLGLKGAKVSTTSNTNGDFVNITYPNISTQQAADEVGYEITHRPNFTLTTLNTQPLFDAHGSIDKNVGSTSAKTWDFSNLSTFDIRDSRVPLAINGSSVVNNNGNLEIHITLDKSAISSWTYLTYTLSQANSQQSSSASTIVFWLDLDSWIKTLQQIQTSSGTLWDEAKNNPYNALFVNNDPTSGLLRTSADYKANTAAEHRIAELPISSANSGLHGYDLVIKGGFDESKANEIVKKINFSTAKYELTLESSKIVAPEYGDYAFRNFAIAAGIAFAIIAIMLMVNYGLLGALATISLALFTFITLSLFTVMRGEYSPESIAALIVGLGLSLDISISTFERFKSEVYLGQNLSKANNNANRKGLWSIIDSNVITLIFATVLFYYGTKSIIGFSATLVISIIVTLVVSVLFTKITAALLINSNLFSNKLWLFGLNQKLDDKVQAKVKKVDFVKQAKWPILLLFAVIIAGAITASVYGGLQKQLFVSSSDLATKMAADSAIAFAISFAIILGYTLLRFRWTYVVTLLVVMTQDILAILAIYLVAKIQLSPSFLAALLGVIAFSLNDKLMMFDRLREKIKTKVQITDEQIKLTANEAVSSMINRAMIMLASLMSITVLLFAFGNIIKWETTLVIFIGAVIMFATSSFVAPRIWVVMEIIRQRGIVHRTKTNFWDTKNVEEQVIVGINDYRQ